MILKVLINLLIEPFWMIVFKRSELEYIILSILDAANKRVGSRAGQFVSSEPHGSNFGWFVSWRDRSDPAAHAKH